MRFIAAFKNAEHSQPSMYSPVNVFFNFKGKPEGVSLGHEIIYNFRRWPCHNSCVDSRFGLQAVVFIV